MRQFHFNYEDLTVLDLKDTGKEIENKKAADGCFLIRRNYFDKNRVSNEQKSNLPAFTGGASTGIFRLALKLMNGRAD